MQSKEIPVRLAGAISEEHARLARDARRREEALREAELPMIRLEGEAALRRLLPIAQSDTGQSAVVARFLLNLYNGERFPFDLSDLRRLDYDPFDDCIAVLTMDSQRFKEVHEYFDDGGTIWETLAKEWGFKDHAGQSWR